MKTWYIHCKQMSVYAPFIHTRWPRPQDQKSAMAISELEESGGERSDRKKHKASVSRDRRYTKSRKEVIDNILRATVVLLLLQPQQQLRETSGAL